MPLQPVMMEGNIFKNEMYREVTTQVAQIYTQTPMVSDNIMESMIYGLDSVYASGKEHVIQDCLLS